MSQVKIEIKVIGDDGFEWAGLLTDGALTLLCNIADELSDLVKP
jgi:hypothetical protein